jgi:hypothetical protein
MKWGKAYGADYANILFSMVRRNTTRPLRFICFTDDATGLSPEIEAMPLPDIALPAAIRWTPWRKVSLWQSPLADLAGAMLFLDLDVVVTASIDPFFDFAPEADFCVIENWTTPGSGVGNTSVFRLKAGSHPEVYSALTQDPQRVLREFTNEQTLASRLVPDRVFWPAEWCVSFKHTLLPRWPLNVVKPARFPHGSRITCFTGHPNPDEARDGIWPAPWYKRVYRQVRPTPWVADHWR